MHPCPENEVAIGHAVVYYAHAAQVFSAEIRCGHCNVSYACYHSVFLYDRIF